MEVTVVAIGRKVPSLRMPALFKGTLQYVGLDHFEDKWILLCFPARLTLEEASFLNREVCFAPPTLEQATLLAVGSDPTLLHQPWALNVSGGSTVLLIDPLKRLHREFGVSVQMPTRCQSFVISPQSTLEFLMVHDLNGRGISTLAEILQAGVTCYRRQKRRPNNSSLSRQGVRYANRPSKRCKT